MAAERAAGGDVAARGDRAAGRLPGSVSGVAAVVLGAARDVLPGAGGVWRRRDGRGVPQHDQPHRGRLRAWVDGDGNHPVHGQGVRCPPQSGGERGVLAARRLPVAARPRLHRRPAGRCRACGVVRAERDQRLGRLRLQLSGIRVHLHGRVPDGGGADAGPGQRDPGDGLGGAEPGRVRRARCRRVHHPGRAVGQPHLGCVDEPCQNVRAGPGRRELHRLLGVRRRAAGGGRSGRRRRVRAARPGRREGRIRRRAG